MDDLANHLRTAADAWDLHRTENTTRLEARTRAAFPDRDAAFAAGQDLVDQVLDLGFELTGVTHVGIWRAEPGEDWRATINVGLTPSG